MGYTMQTNWDSNSWHSMLIFKAFIKYSFSGFIPLSHTSGCGCLFRFSWLWKMDRFKQIANALVCTQPEVCLLNFIYVTLVNDDNN